MTYNLIKKPKENVPYCSSLFALPDKVDTVIDIIAFFLRKQRNDFFGYRRGELTVTLNLSDIGASVI